MKHLQTHTHTNKLVITTYLNLKNGKHLNKQNLREKNATQTKKMTQKKNKNKNS